MRTVKIGKYLVTFDDSIAFTQYDEAPFYYGVLFSHDGDKFDLLSNRDLGERLIIVRKESPMGFVDMPFHFGTAQFLPDLITVTSA